MSDIRSPICTVLGHVDHGKSSILDAIRETSIVKTEAGAITQAIGASIIPLSTIQKRAGNLLKALNMKFTIPGLLFIDTPGHAAFTSLRKRGGNLADIAVLVVNINEGFKPQTIEALEVLKFYKTPFIVAANKLDLIPGWDKNRPGTVLQKIKAQGQSTFTAVETKLYEIVGKLSEKGINSERFDRVDDFTKQVAIVPVSAITQEGIPELLMVITGLAQKYLEKCLKCDICSPAKGTILEVKEEKGLGVCLDVIIYDGCLNVNDIIVIGSMDAPIVTKVRGLFEPATVQDIRDKKSKFRSVKKVVSAMGVRVSAPDIENAVAGMPLRVASKETLDQVKKEIAKEVEEVLIETEKDGIIIKADTIGSLEALTNMLKEHNIPVRKASIGHITKKDVAEAESNYETDKFSAVILGFNITASEEIKASSSIVHIFTHDVIYSLVDDFEKWKLEQEEKEKTAELDNVTRPCKFKVMENYVFRQSNPAIVGCDILVGKLRVGVSVMNEEGKVVSQVKSIQHEKKSISELESGKQAAISFPGATVGRQINEGDILYANIPEDDFRRLKKMKSLLRGDEVDVLRYVAEIKRKNNPVWGV